jgi:hypothetical protein
MSDGVATIVRLGTIRKHHVATHYNYLDRKIDTYQFALSTFL